MMRAKRAQFSVARIMIGIQACLAMSITLAACGSSSNASTQSTGTLSGRVTAGPTCPVERVGHPCPPAPVSATVLAKNADGTVVGTTHTDKDGRYRLRLPPGSYKLLAVTPMPLPRCPPVNVNVSASRTTRVGISCDSGIR